MGIRDSQALTICYLCVRVTEFNQADKTNVLFPDFPERSMALL
jgi:hypothetical protein